MEDMGKRLYKGMKIKSITNSKTSMGIRKVHTWRHVLEIARLMNINEISFLQMHAHIMNCSDYQ